MKFVKQYNYLGMILGNELSLTPLYNTLEKRIIDKVYMLRKLCKYWTYKSALQIYKQTILPIFNYPGFILLACSKDKNYDLQVIQDDVLRIFENKQLEDRVAIELLHKKANLVSREQRHVKQLL